MRRALLAAALLAAAAGCTSSRPEPVRTLTEADDGGALTLRVGDVVAVELRANATTGYAWEARDDGTGVLLREAGPDYRTDPSAAGMVGVGGAASWRYRALRPGRATLTFAYRRSWEQAVAPVDTRTFRVTVAPAAR